MNLNRDAYRDLIRQGMNPFPDSALNEQYLDLVFTYSDNRDPMQTLCEAACIRAIMDFEKLKRFIIKVKATRIPATGQYLIDLYGKYGNSFSFQLENPFYFLRRDTLETENNLACLESILLRYLRVIDNSWDTKPAEIMENLIK